MVAGSGGAQGVQRLRSLRFGCAACQASRHGICTSDVRRVTESVIPRRYLISQSSYATKARHLIVHDHDFDDAAPIICSGWAACFKLLADGRRQILSILLPGDIVSARLLFAPNPGLVIEAITDVHYQMFKREELRNFLFHENEFLENVLESWLAEQARSDRLIADLGRRSGEERIARMILSLAHRLKTRGMMRNPLEMDFPLRQHHIADATGLTQVHVSKVVSDFRRSGLTEFRQRSLTLLDVEGLRRRADIHSGPDDVFYALPAM